MEENFKGYYTKEQFLKFEKIIFCNFLKYNANIKTPFVFISELLYRGVVLNKEVDYTDKESFMDTNFSHDIELFFY